MKKLIILGVSLLFLLGFSDQSLAGIRIGVSIPPPPSVVFTGPPELVVIPGTYVYYPPDADVEIFFYEGYWYRPYAGYWYRSADYRGPWVYIEGPPRVLLNIPHNYRVVTRGYRRVPYGELHSHWRAWERGRYWERHNWGRPENERHFGLSPSFREREPRRDQGAPHFRERAYGEHGGQIHERGGFQGRGGHEGHERR